MIYLVTYLLLEPIKRVLSALCYPFIYPFRRNLRMDRILWGGYLLEPKGNLPSFLCWLFLDDSIFIEQAKEYDDKEKRYPKWIWKINKPWLKSWWWSAIRNSCVNLNNASAYMLGSYIKELKHFGSGRNFYKVREYERGIRPYIEFYVFWRWNQVGWLRGSATGASRFEIDLFKKRG